MSRRQPPEPGAGEALPSDYDTDPGRFAATQAATQRFSTRGDIHPLIARRMAAAGCRIVIDIGGGTGTLARLLTSHGISTVVVDRAGHVTRAPRPAIRADGAHLALPRQHLRRGGSIVHALPPSRPRAGAAGGASGTAAARAVGR